MISIVTMMMAGCASAPVSSPAPAPIPADVVPGNAAWRMTPGTWAEYDYATYNGTADPAVCMIAIDPSTVRVLQQERQTNLAYHMPMDVSQRAVARVQTQSGTAATVVDSSLAYVLVERQNATVIGEAANSGAASQDPPEPYITVNPMVGEVIDTTSLITTFDGVTGYFPTRYRTIATSVTWDGFPDAVVATLTERPGPGERCYTWIFSGGEIAEEIIGIVGADGHITDGGLLRRVRTGVNP